jgi:hypothetical protein
MARASMPRASRRSSARCSATFDRDQSETDPSSRILCRLTTEDEMTTNEFYYLLLVLGAFGSFAVALALSQYRYQTWRRDTSHEGHPAE